MFKVDSKLAISRVSQSYGKSGPRLLLIQNIILIVLLVGASHCADMKDSPELKGHRKLIGYYVSKWIQEANVLL